MPLTLIDYKTMPYPERCRCIGELLGLAVVRYFRQQRVTALACLSEVAQARVQLDLSEIVSDETEKKFIRHLMLAGEATPLDLCAMFHISPATAFRKLARLRTAGIVSVTGKSRAARYQLTGIAGKN